MTWLSFKAATSQNGFLEDSRNGIQGCIQIQKKAKDQIHVAWHLLVLCQLLVDLLVGHIDAVRIFNRPEGYI